MYKNPNLAPEVRAADLLSKMTVEEKLDQIIFFHTLKEVSENITNGVELPPRCGTFGNLSALEDTKAAEHIGDYFLNKTRLGIPLLMAFESLHGLMNFKATVFPQCAGLGGTFDRELIYKMAQIIGRECKALGVHQVFAPNVDIPREPRWGRTQEAYGEDPYLVGEMGANYVKGVQENGVAATAKHYIAYGFPEGGINLAPAHVGEREIREVYLEPFKKCIDAGVLSVMPAYNEVDGIPVHASKKLLRDILRDELGFEGTTISDWGAVEMFLKFHQTAPDRLTAGKMAIEAGVDIEAPEPIGYDTDFREAVKNGDIDIKLIDEAVLRVLTLKFKLGLFENPFPCDELKPYLNNQEAKDLSREMDEKSILLLKNDGILPLDEKKVGTVAIIGNNGKRSFMGDYILRTESCIDFYDGMVQRLGSDRVLYAEGCGPLLGNDEMIAEAVEQAKKADTVFLVLGDRAERGGGAQNSGVFSNNQITCSEGYDTNDLRLPAAQQKLFDAIVALGKPTVLVMYAGRQYAIKDEVEKVNGFMFSWGAGEQSGVAFANLIFGDKSPSAKLTFSFPQSTGHIPCYYNYKASARGRLYKRPGTPEEPGMDYVLASPDAWLPFGYGLSYTTVEYSDLQAQVKDNGEVAVSVCVENTGAYEIDESVLLFVQMLYCPVTPFIKKLRRFEKVNLKIGEKKTVNFTLNGEDFTYIDEDMKTAQNHGKHMLYIDKLACAIEI
ncbi:MAG: glycoside hydrolase family 3 C-terminal domain-containing protein [Clostridia bacterium]|nr:glycoside hydrolase family 3 C-terminal domain-containing protein [Clostridia bacterium]